jgi:hypothetical protein
MFYFAYIVRCGALYAIATKNHRLKIALWLHKTLRADPSCGSLLRNFNNANIVMTEIQAIHFLNKLTLLLSPALWDLFHPWWRGGLAKLAKLSVFRFESRIDGFFRSLLVTHNGLSMIYSAIPKL